ncbi:RHS repeat-associated core domain-containing protein [Phytohabitans sp. LJ34]|uniref:RHS repeat-associated core domain-containing protein n=1 Tax=Phytohabitans sp. LJ34 TaxID=3452217 RepID=UPI003F8AF67C
MTSRLHLLVRLTAVVALLVGAAIVAYQLPERLRSGALDPDLGTPVEAQAVTGASVDPKAEGVHVPDQRWSGAKAADWPAAGVTEVPLRARGVDAARTGTLAATAALRVFGQDVSAKLGIDGVVYQVSSDRSGQADVKIDYSRFAGAFGGGWASRLRLLALPGCALSEPAKPGCLTGKKVESVNDIRARSVTATVDLAGDAVVFALAAEDSGATGDWSATDLSHAGSWSQGGSSGGFGYSYALRVPPGAGRVPELSLSYSSQAVDGHTSSSNNQAGLIGDGWGYNPGLIERTYTGCFRDKGGNTPTATGDWCWDGASDAVTVSLGGVNAALVKDDTTGQWHVATDSGWKVERLGAAATASTATSEQWRITATDGTRYMFASRAGSRLTAPVFGNHSGEPCHRSGDFKGSACAQAYRWLLDQVVDVHGNVTRYEWSTETGHYGAAADEDNRKGFHRAARLTRIEYGLRADDASVAATGRVVFSYADRCESDCRESGGDPRPDNWPETPWDLDCAAAPCTGKLSMAFFASQRMTSIATYVRKGATYSKVDSWALEHDFLHYGDEEDTVLWLASVQHTGHVGGTESTPPVRFAGTPMANRLEHSEGEPSLWRTRLSRIVTETGSEVLVWYSAEDCAWDDRPSPRDNGRRCYPMFADKGPDEEPAEEWFHKYVVTQVAEFDTTAGQLPLRTYYEYATTTGGTSRLWAWNDSELVDDDLRSYSQWRGYAQVTTKVGDPAQDTPLTSVARYYRGLDGQPDTATGTGSRAVKVTDSEGNQVTDHEALAGSVFESVEYEGAAVIDATVNRYWTKRTATREHDGGTTEAWLTGTSRTDTRRLLDAATATWQRTLHTAEFDGRGRPVAGSDSGDLAASGDERCTRTTYLDDTAKHLYERPHRVQVFAVPCATTPSLPGDLVTDQRISYDGATSAVAAVEEVSAHDGSAATWLRTAAYTYDKFGRQTAETDALGETTTTAYTPAGSGVTESAVTTNPLGHATTVHNEPAWGVPARTVDPNGRVTELAYDPLGRTVAAWGPGWKRADHPDTPTAEYRYRMKNDGPSAVMSFGLNADGEQRLDGIALFDALLRPVQEQAPTAQGGRLVTSTRYDTRGLTEWSSGPNWVDGAGPGVELVAVSQGQDHARTLYTYDAAGRVATESFMSHQQIRWTTRTRYGGSTKGWMERVDPPRGGTPSATVVNLQGEVVEKRDYHGATADGAYDTTVYDYDRRGRLETVTDPARNQWSYEYDLRGRRVAAHDPDTGTTRAVYDDANRIVATTDARGQTVSTEYDALGRMTARWSGAPRTGVRLAAWAYDKVAGGIGLPYTSTSYVDGKPLTTQVSGYDAAGRPATTVESIPAIAGLESLAGSYRTSQYYNPDGSVSHTNVPAVGGLARESVVFEYNDLGQATRVWGEYFDGSGTVVDYVDGAAYTAWGELGQRVLGGAGGKRVYQTWTYEDGTRRAAEYRLSRDAVGTTNVAHLSYRYDPSGNILSIADAVTDAPGAPERQCFVYDYLRRLTDAWAQAGTGDCVAQGDLGGDDLGGPAPYWTSYTYDVTGNRTSVTGRRADGTSREDGYAYVEGRAHLVEKAGADTFTWDGAGNLTKRVVGGRTETLGWNAQGKLTTITGGEGTTRMVYDAGNKRVARVDPDGSATVFVAGHEITASPTGVTSAVRGYRHNGTVVATRSASGGVVWIGNDHQNTSTWAVSATTATVTHRRQDPFGNDRGSNRPWTANQQGYHAGTEDLGGLVSMGARFYDPVTGRFISRDPIVVFEDVQQVNGYSYASNNPVTTSDPSGLRELECSPGAEGCDSNGRAEPKPCGTTGKCSKSDPGWTRTVHLPGDNELVLTNNGSYLNGVPITGAWSDPLELALDVLETMDEHGLSNSTADTIKALYLLCESSEKYAGCNGYSRALSDLYDIAMCATEGACVEIELCANNTCQYVNAEDILEAMVTYEEEHYIGTGDGFTVLLSMAYSDYAAAAGDACAVHGRLAATGCAAGGNLSTALQVHYGCVDNADANERACLGALIGLVTTAMNSYMTSRALTGDYTRSPINGTLRPGSPWGGK